MSDGISEEVALMVLATFLGLASTAVIAAVRYARRMLHSMDRIEETVLPHFAPPRPGQPDVSLPARVEHIASEVSANHGRSIKDVIDRLDREAVEHRAVTDARFASIESALADLARPPLTEGA